MGVAVGLARVLSSKEAAGVQAKEAPIGPVGAPPSTTELPIQMG